MGGKWAEGCRIHYSTYAFGKTSDHKAFPHLFFRKDLDGKDTFCKNVKQVVSAY